MFTYILLYCNGERPLLHVANVWCVIYCLIGIALREHDVLAVARLRGMQLSKFEVLEECITAFNHGESEFEEDFSMSFETFCEEVGVIKRLIAKYCTSIGLRLVLQLVVVFYCSSVLI